jgi:hypothetical protein
MWNYSRVSKCVYLIVLWLFHLACIVHLKCDGTRAETKFLLSPKRTSPFKSAGASVQSTAGSLGVRVSISNAGYTTFRGSLRVLATHSIRQFPLHFPSRASPCAIRFQTHSILYCGCLNLFCNVWVCVCAGVLVICVLVFTVLCIVWTVFLYCFVYVYLFLFVLSVVL